MGLSQSQEDSGHAPSPEHLSLLLAERFATKCFTPLELTHFKDNFFTRATDQGGLKYWNEKTLSDFLGVPDHSDVRCPLDAGPVIFRMVSYLGAFPFQNTLAPSVLTFEAMVKIAVLLTERYGKVLRRGRRDRIRLLFGSLADVGRKDVEKPAEKEEHAEEAAASHAHGFDIDAPANDDYDDDEDDDLALAALESLDAIEVFKHDSRIDRKVYETRISVSTFRRLLMLLLVIAPLKPLEDVCIYTSDLNDERMNAVRTAADNILAAFAQEPSGGISYKTFADTITTSFPYLFDPLTPLFEHLLFSKNLDFSQKRGSDAAETTLTPNPPETATVSITLPGSFESTILSPSVISHLSFFLPSTSVNQNILRGNIRLHPVFSTSAHGSSLTSFSHNVLTWQSGTLLLLEGVDTELGTTLTIGCHLPQPWKSSTSSSPSLSTSVLPSLFRLSPKHTLLQGNPSPSILDKSSMPTAYFSQHHGISIGCQIPPSSRTRKLPPTPHGAGSLIIDTSLEVAEFHISPVRHDGVFLPPGSISGTGPSTKPTKTVIDIYTLEIWGLVPEPETSSSSALSQGMRGQSAVEIQQAQWDFEAREAERRRHVNLKAGAGDSAVEQARWLLETAGIIGDSGRSGGST
ncbi:TLD-domain-containing protein [Aspergillus lucknowensis]|uniref:TLD-domain-containing protein n=1 Tax=Aspergillus lucknowensis TaxID=176173 RepID=A0ABR4LI86_9EURO